MKRVGSPFILAVSPPCLIRVIRPLHHNPEPSGEILHELPGNATRAGAARGRPFQRLAMHLLARMRNADNGRHSHRPWPEIRPGCNGGNPSHRPKRSDSETFSSTASPGLIADERSFSTMSRAIRWRRLEVA